MKSKVIFSIPTDLVLFIFLKRSDSWKEIKIMKMHVATVHQNASFDAIFDTHPETSLDLSHVEAVLKKDIRNLF